MDYNYFVNLNLDNKLAQSTIKSYWFRFKQLVEYIKNENNNDFNLLYLIKYKNKVIDIINHYIVNNSTKIVYISSILYVLNYFIINKNYINIDDLNIIKNDYKTYFTKIRNEIKENNTGEFSEKEKENILSYSEITNIFNDNYNKYIDIIKKKTIVKIDDYYKIQNMVILSFYVLIMPVRNKEIASLKYKKYDDNTDNYIDINNKLLIFNDYKTSKKYKKNIIDLKDNNKLIDLIKSFILFKNKNGFKKEYLFNSNTDTNLDKSSITHRLNAIINKKISSSMIRKIFITDNKGDYINNLNNTAKNMMNSPNVLISHYNKN